MSYETDILLRVCQRLEVIYHACDSNIKDLDAIKNVKALEGAFDSLWYHSTRIYNLSKAYLAEIEDIKGDLT